MVEEEKRLPIVRIEMVCLECDQHLVSFCTSVCDLDKHTKAMVPMMELHLSTMCKHPENEL